jgi:hypothetical protein
MALKDDIAADVADVLLADFGEACTYHADGQPPKAVVLRITPAAERPRTPSVGGNTGAPMSGGGLRFRVLAKAWAAGELFGGAAAPPEPGLVGDAGGIVRIRAADYFTVPGAAVNQPHLETVRVRVAGDARLSHGKWLFEVLL